MKDRINITIDTNILKSLQKTAENERRTVSNLINLILEKWQEEQDEKELQAK